MIITMDGEYAFESDPAEKVRILCVDAPGEYPVVVMHQNGYVTKVAASGERQGHPVLTPLQRQPREFWANIYPVGEGVMHDSKHSALQNCRDNGETIHVREVLE